MTEVGLGHEEGQSGRGLGAVEVADCSLEVSLVVEVVAVELVQVGVGGRVLEMPLCQLVPHPDPQ